MIEDVGSEKTATAQVETVKDTVRETNGEGTAGGLPKTPAATDGAGTSGANAPRR